MLELYTFLSCLLILIPNLLILVSLKGKKPIKVKEDILFLEKLILKCLILLLYLVLFIAELLIEDDEENEKVENEKQKNIYKIKIISFNIYIVLLFSSNFFLCIEDYFTYTNPNHYFNSIFHNSKCNIIYETISICFVIGLSVFYLYNNLKPFILYEEYT